MIRCWRTRKVRSNTSFTVNYENNNLTPQIEIILLTTEPKYIVNKQRGIDKGVELGEFRLFTDKDGINEMIGQLQLLAANLQTFEQMSVGINTIIDQSMKKKGATNEI